MNSIRRKFYFPFIQWTWCIQPEIVSQRNPTPLVKFPRLNARLSKHLPSTTPWMEGIKRGHRVELPPLNWGATKNEGKKKKNWFNERPRATCRDVDFELSRRYLSRDRISFLGIKLCSKIRFNTSFMIARDFGLICGDLRAISPSSFSFSLFPLPLILPLTWKNSCFRMFSSSLHFFLYLKRKRMEKWIKRVGF